VYKVLNASFRVSGREKGVLEMLELLESLPYHSEIKSVNFTRNADKDAEINTADLAVQIQITLAEKI
jgi:hypothetical protein